MPHLIEPIKREQDNPLPIADAIRDIQEAHDYLVTYGIEALKNASQITKRQTWGSLVKRVKINLPNDNHPKLIPNDITDSK